jgi:ribosomal protein S27E
MADYKPCMRCNGPTNIHASSLLPVLCSPCTRGNVLPATGTAKVKRGWRKLWRGRQ